MFVTPMCFGQANIRLDPTILRGRCAGDVVSLTCTTTGSPILAWKSEEYIGPGTTQLEFGGVNNVGDTVSSQRYPSTVATLTDKRPASSELTSTIEIILSAETESSVVTCVNVGTTEVIHATISLLGKSSS